MLNTLPETPSDIDILWRSFVCGAGFGIFQSPNNREIMSNVKAQYSSYASGVLAIMRTFGQSLGSVLIGVMLAYAHRHNMDNIQSASYAGIEMGLWIAAASVGLAVALSIRDVTAYFLRFCFSKGRWCARGDPFSDCLYFC